uniref:phytol kinase n=1 Tax=Chromera velia CCMP2878 TaxID=1169474 RepID=A0A0G4IDB8_9ALVE|eukprot:Cvel_13350.t1-p1 / transcript=Cvel_13350.t1 / gene=Cvel_13350 / organism=Chromera_velia_CCMP2878 / gene_product=hypothetical protein / transcript_product=hypothetical protein / location=Cvel_scaffold907:10936-12554(-) / protein_length=441 / sequence_SO=supercontig / SO=protein_coding / is_pseudo=false
MELFERLGRRLPTSGEIFAEIAKVEKIVEELQLFLADRPPDLNEDYSSKTAAQTAALLVAQLCAVFFPRQKKSTLLEAVSLYMDVWDSVFEDEWVNAVEKIASKATPSGRDEVEHGWETETSVESAPLCESGREVLSLLVRKAEEKHYKHMEEVYQSAGSQYEDWAKETVPFDCALMRRAAWYLTESARVVQKKLEALGPECGEKGMGEGGKSCKEAVKNEEKGEGGVEGHGVAVSLSAIAEEHEVLKARTRRVELNERLGDTLRALKRVERQLEKAGITFFCDHCERFESLDNRFKFCSRCERVRYCSIDCQRAAWPQHKKQCKRLAERGKGAAVIEESAREEMGGGAASSSAEGPQSFTIGEESEESESESEEEEIDPLCPSWADIRKWERGRVWGRGKGKRPPFELAANELSASEQEEWERLRVRVETHASRKDDHRR